MKWSRRWPAASKGTAMVRGSAMGCLAWRVFRRRVSDTPGLLFKQYQRAGDYEHNTGGLRDLENTAEKCPATDGVAPEFGDVDCDAGSHEAEACDISLLTAVGKR